MNIRDITRAMMQASGVRLSPKEKEILRSTYEAGRPKKTPETTSKILDLIVDACGERGTEADPIALLALSGQIRRMASSLRAALKVLDSSTLSRAVHKPGGYDHPDYYVDDVKALSEAVDRLSDIGCIDGEIAVTVPDATLLRPQKEDDPIRLPEIRKVRVDDVLLGALLDLQNLVKALTR